MEKTLKSSAINLGLYLGLILSAFTIIGYAVYLDLFTKWWFGIGTMILVIIIGIMSATKARKLSGGFISFKSAFTSYFTSIVIGLAISTVVSIVLFNFIDTEAGQLLQEKIIESQMAMLENFGAPQEAIDDAMQRMEGEDNFFSIGNVVKSFAYQLLGFSIVGLIVAAVVKRKDPHAA